MTEKKWVNAIIILAAVYGVVQGTFFLWDRFKPSPFRLEAEVHYAPFRLPTAVLQAGDKIRARIASEEIRKEIVGLEEWQGAKNLEAAEDFVGRAQSHLDLELMKQNYTVEQYMRFQGLFTFDIQNRSAQAVKSVTIVLSSPNHALILRQGAEPRNSNGVDRLDVGTLQPDESARVYVWSTIESSDPKYDIQRMQLTHEMGRGTLQYASYVGSFGLFVDRISFFLVLATMLIGSAVAMALIERLGRWQAQRESAARRATQKSQNSKKNKN